MPKQSVSKPDIFWTPSLETARKIDDDTIKSIESAQYRCGEHGRISSAVTMNRRAGCAPRSSWKCRHFTKVKPRNHREERMSYNRISRARNLLNEAPIKSAEQQATLMLHKTRELLVKQRTMSVNALRANFPNSVLSSPRESAASTNCSSWPK